MAEVAEMDAIEPTISEEIQTREKRFMDYKEFRDNIKPLSHIKLQRGMDYQHHFIIFSVSKISENLDAITVGQYTSSGEIFTESSHGIGKFERTILFVDRLVNSVDECPDNKGLLDFKAGVYLVTMSNYPKSDEEVRNAYERLNERINERMYDISSNNCEHAVSFILTGKSSSEQADEKRCSKRCRVDFCNVLLIDCKEVGIRTSLIVAALGAIAGSLVRRAYVRIILASLISLTVGNQLIDCGSIKGNNIRTEAEKRIDLATDLSDINAVIERENLDILINTKKHLDTDFVCSLAEKLLYDAALKTSGATLAVSVGIETIFFLSFVFFNLLARRKKKVLESDKFCRILFLNIFSSYGSIVLAVVCGYFAFLDLHRPALTFFGVVFGSCFVLRYILTCIAGLLFDCCCFQCCWSCCDSRCSTGCMNCCQTNCRWFKLSTLCCGVISFSIIAAIIVSLVCFFFL